MRPEEDPTTEELRAAQAEREAVERDRARESETEEEMAGHERRAEKSAYLKRKLAERAESERG
jgi:hypothetical protein